MKKIIGFGLIALAVACSPKTTQTGKVENTQPLTADAERGKVLYESECTKCHKAYTVTKFSAEKWKHIVPEMCKMGKINADNEKLILTYVLEVVNNK